MLAAEAYLRATVTNGPLLLLPGQARIFHGPQFVGETHLDSVAPGEEFEVQLGVDDQIKVERKLRRRTTSKAVIGGTRTIDIAYEITVENHRDRKATVSVHDHIPVSTDGDIKVRARETTPPRPAPMTSVELTWTLILPRGGVVSDPPPLHGRAPRPGHGDAACNKITQSDRSERVRPTSTSSFLSSDVRAGKLCGSGRERGNLAAQVRRLWQEWLSHE